MCSQGGRPSPIACPLLCPNAHKLHGEFGMKHFLFVLLPALPLYLRPCFLLLSIYLTIYLSISCFTEDFSLIVMRWLEYSVKWFLLLLLVCKIQTSHTFFHLLFILQLVVLLVLILFAVFLDSSTSSSSLWFLSSFASFLLLHLFFCLLFFPASFLEKIKKRMVKGNHTTAARLECLGSEGSLPPRSE